MNKSSPVVFLVDVDDTLLDNDRIQSDFKRHFESEFGARCGARYWTIQEELFNQLGYRDYLEALQRFRVEHPYEPRLITAANFLIDYPFADRLYPRALEVLKRLREWGQTVILTDGDIIYQPRKVQHTGIFKAVEGQVLIYVHKEKALEDIKHRYPAEHYVLIDDKLRILTAFKKAWGNRITTVFPRQGGFAHDPNVLAAYPAADIAVERISDLLSCDLPDLLASRQSAANDNSESTSTPIVFSGKAGADNRT
jgi:FMN phosphatase YigB (HAD superfamily)